MLNNKRKVNKYDASFLMSSLTLRLKFVLHKQHIFSLYTYTAILYTYRYKCIGNEIVNTPDTNNFG